jgi:hypothetical protein
MTKEQAVEILNEIIDEGWLISDFDKCIAIDACEMAIKALEQQPSDDCVSRTQALKELKESAEHHANDSREEVLLRRDRDIIRALPSVTPIHGMCKDCKYNKKISRNRFECENGHRFELREPSTFSCADFERRE